MNFSQVKIKLTEEDLRGIVGEVLKDYAKFPQITINRVSIDNIIIVEGVYKTKVAIKFISKLSIQNLVNNVIYLSIQEIKVAKIKVFSFIKNFALKTGLKDFQCIGIKACKDSIEIDLNTLSYLIPFVNFQVKEVNLGANCIDVEVNNIIYNKEKKFFTFDDFKEKGFALIEEQKEQENNYISMKASIEENKARIIGKEKKDRLKDNYTKVRASVEHNIPDKYKELGKYLLILPDIIALLYRLFKDERVDIKNKITLGGVLLYLIMPIDILPDRIPFIGKIDDLAISFFALDKIINEVPEEVILENWQGDKDIVIIIKEGVGYLTGLVGGNNVKTVLNFIKMNLKKGNFKINEEK